jgi:hypothetical protein
VLVNEMILVEKCQLKKIGRIMHGGIIIGRKGAKLSGMDIVPQTQEKFLQGLLIAQYLKKEEQVRRKMYN